MPRIIVERLRLAEHQNLEVASAADSMLLHGERDAYELGPQVGEGAHGVVCEATARSDGARVALKLLVGGDSHRADRERRSVLSHPHIVAVRDHGHDAQGRPFLVMEYLDGGSLRAWLSRRPLGMSQSEVVSVMRQIAEALAYAHQRRVVHRDIKPENVMFSRPQELDLRLVDFGIARWLDERTLTRTSERLGTVLYMSPEQLYGKADLDGRSDLWALGVMAFEMLAGRRPFEGDGVVYKIIHERHPALAHLSPAPAPELISIIDRLLEKDPARRFGTAQELLDALRAVPESARSFAGGARSLGEAPTMPQESLAEPEASERRLVSLVFLRGVTDLAAVTAQSRLVGCELFSAIDGTALGVFGGDRWSGDEPSRAVRFAELVMPFADSIGVASGRTLRSASRVFGPVVDRAAGLAQQPGMWFDAETTDAVRRASSTPFVGRDADLRWLLETVDEAAASAEPQVAIVHGPGGSGKSRLLFEAQRGMGQAPDGARLLLARCHADRLGASLSLIRDLLASVRDDDLAAALAFESVAGNLEMPVDRVRVEVARALEELCADGPVVLAVDDAHWMDRVSADLLAWVLSHARHLPCAVWVFSRPERTAELMELFPDASVRPLKALSRKSALDLLRGLSPDAPESLVAVAEGLPLLIEALAQVYGAGRAEDLDAGTVPVVVEGFLQARLDRLGETARDFLQRAAILGRTGWDEAVMAMGGDAQALPGLDRERLVTIGARSRFASTLEFSFANDLLTSVASRRWTTTQRDGLHARIANWMEGRREAAPAEIAVHWERAGEMRHAAGWYVRAAQESSRFNDLATTRDFVAKVMSLTDDPRHLWGALAAQDDALQLSKERALQRESLLRMRGLADRLGDRELLELSWRQCYQARVNGDVTDALSYGMEAMALADVLDDARWGAAVHVELALLHTDEGDHARGLRHATLGSELAQRSGDPWMVARCRATEGYVIVEMDRPSDAMLCFEEAARAYGSVGDRRREAVARSNFADAALRLGRLDAAYGAATAALELSRSVGNQRTEGVTRLHLALLHRLRGELSTAREDLRAAESLAVAVNHVRLRAGVAYESVLLAMASGSTPAALLGAVDAAYDAAVSARTPVLIAQALAAKLWIHESAKRDVTALRREAEALCGQGGLDSEARTLLQLRVAGGLTGAVAALFDQHVRRIAVVGEEGPCRDAFLRRHGVPEPDVV